jgi:hypothetical protein
MQWTGLVVERLWPTVWRVCTWSTEGFLFEKLPLWMSFASTRAVLENNGVEEV